MKTNEELRIELREMIENIDQVVYDYISSWLNALDEKVKQSIPVSKQIMLIDTSFLNDHFAELIGFVHGIIHEDNKNIDDAISYLREEGYEVKKSDNLVLKEREEKRMAHHKEFHVPAISKGQKHCVECGARLQNRCPNYPELGRDCGNWECSYCVNLWWC